ncbi:hypothetical protein G6M04_14590 [Agrobacterium rhizogenes]|uniref:hypothetical protein n=1 Tax=Rhizobium rhizogenes TaxID=359 RepID=UPI00157264D1|nr:hypothetical protein [Rhizobium rhizogenes]NTG48618.1 hypothetical protein [Rhizobium rhizogenes]
MTTYQFTFEELKIPLYGEGALFYGEATLESACEGDDEFYVSSIQLGKTTLTRPSRINNADPVGGFLFTEIVKQIEDDKSIVGKQAAGEWTDAVSGQVSDFVPALRRRHGMPMARIPEISPTRSYAMEAAE